MSAAAEAHATLEAIVDWLARDGDDVAADEALESHLFECDKCAALAERLAAVTETLRTELPMVIDATQLAALRRRGLRVRERDFAPGVRGEAVFTADVDLLVHRLGGLELADADRVDVRIGIESDGRTLAVVHRVPFDRDGGIVRVLCQRHFLELPPDTVMQVRVIAPSGERTAEYAIFHRVA